MRQPGAQQQILKDANTISQPPVDVQCGIGGGNAITRMSGERDIGLYPQGLRVQLAAGRGLADGSADVLLRERRLALLQRQLCSQTGLAAITAAVVRTECANLGEIGFKAAPVAIRQVPLRMPEQGCTSLCRRIRQAAGGQQGLQGLPGQVGMAATLLYHGQSDAALTLTRPVINGGCLTHGQAESCLGPLQIALCQGQIGLVVTANGGLGGG